MCPEQLGGLTTPRTPAEQLGGKVITKDGRDVTAEFKKGAQRTLLIAQQVGTEVAILKATSPSCGKEIVYDGTHSGTLVEGNGETAGLLLRNGIRVLSEEELQQPCFAPVSVSKPSLRTNSAGGPCEPKMASPSTD